MKIPAKYRIYQDLNTYRWFEVKLEIKYKLPNKYFYSSMCHDLDWLFPTLAPEIYKDIDDVDNITLNERIRLCHEVIDKLTIEEIIRMEVQYEINRKQIEIKKLNTKQDLINSVLTDGWSAIEIEIVDKE